MSYTNPKVSTADLKLARPTNLSDADPAASHPITFARLNGPPHSRLTKAFSIDNDGNIEKDSTPNFSDGNAKSINIENLPEIQPVIESLRSNECIATGVFDVPECRIVTQSNYEEDDFDRGIRTRTKNHMYQPPVGLALLDYDTNPNMPEHISCESAEALMTKAIEACPELDGIAYSACGSASSGIFTKDTGEVYSGSGGMHVYFAVSGVDLVEFHRYLEVKLWNAGFGYIAFAKNGAMLLRTIVDLSVLSPERLIYEAPPVLSEGIGQKERTWKHHPGESLNGIPALTNEETARYEELVTEAKMHADTVAQAEALLDSHHAERVRKLASTKQIDTEKAEKLLPRPTLADLEKSTQTLDPNDIIEVDGREISVLELLERGEELDGKAMPDPVEGRAYGKTTAKFYYNDGQSPCINSFAHGVKTVYKLNQQALVSKIPGQPNNRALAFNHADLTKPLDPDGFPHTVTLRNGSVKPICTIQNVQYLLFGHHITVRYNPITKEIEILIPGQTGFTENSANTAIEIINSLAAMNNMPIGQVPKYVAAIADLNPYNPVANWITGKPWDGKDRLSDICNTLTAQDDYPDNLRDKLIRKWLISVVAAATKTDGFHARGVLTLQGPQLIGKTSWIRNLMPPGLLRDKSILTGHHLDPGNKDSLTTAIKHLIVEIGELDSSFRKDVARLKGFITQDRDSVRRPYARTNAEYQRRTVFCATVNEENFLIDKTGNSRFWVIPVTSIDYNHQIDMQQIFAQLKLQLDDGAMWWLTREEEDQLEELNRRHRSVSVIEEKLLEIFDLKMAPEKWTNMAASEVLVYIGYNKPANALSRECGGVLRDHFGPPKKIQGIMKWRIPINTRNRFTSLRKP